VASTDRTWWYDDGGTCLLKGVPDDPLNKVRLPDNFILSFLWKIPVARDQFVVILPSLLPEEQDRLNTLIDTNPYVKILMPCPQDVTDSVQRKWNRSGVRVRLPRRVLQ